MWHLGDLPAGTRVTQEMIGEIFDALDDPLPGQAAEPARSGLPLGGIAAGIALMAALLGFML